MAVAHEKTRYLAHFTETVFGTGGPADWSVNGTYFYVTNVDATGLVEAVVENENNVVDPRELHDNIPTLRQGNVTFGCYLHSKPGTPAAEDAAATTYHLAELAYAALGGQDLGYAAAVVTSGGEATNEIEIDTDPGYAVGDFVYYLSEDGIGEFYRITGIAAGPPITLTVDRAVHVAVADRSTDDTLRAVIDVYVDGLVTTQHDHANHKTLQMLVQGTLTDDVQIAKGCKPNLTIEPISAGVPCSLTFDLLCATFDAADEATREDFGAAVPVGEAPLVPGRGTSTRFKMASVGDPLVEVVTRGQITANPGVVYERVESPNGLGGVEGYVDTLEAGTLEVMVNFDSDYNADFRAGVHKHALIQVGDGADSIGIYYPELEIAADPPRNDQGMLAGSTLQMRAHLNSVADGASLSGANLRKWRSGFHLLLLA